MHKPSRKLQVSDQKPQTKQAKITLRELQSEKFPNKLKIEERIQKWSQYQIFTVWLQNLTFLPHKLFSKVVVARSTYTPPQLQKSAEFQKGWIFLNTLYKNISWTPSTFTKVKLKIILKHHVNN